MKVWRKIGMSEVVVPLLPECIMGMDIVSDWGTTL